MAKSTKGIADQSLIGNSPQLSGRPRVQTAARGLGTVDRADTLADQAYANIKTALMSGQLVPGERVSMRHIAEVFGISLTPARDALARLSAERALAVDPRRTFRVPVLNSADYRELLAIRLLLEGHATQAGVPRMSRQAVDDLERLNTKFAAAIESGSVKESLELNRQFHFSIYRAAEMPELFAIIEGLWVRVGPTLNLLHPGYQRGRRGLNNHLAALEAIRAGNADLAKAAIERDLVDGAEHILRLLEDSRLAHG